MAIPQVPHSTYSEFKAAVNGNAYDVDGWYGAQCWDGVDLLYQQNDVGQYLYTAYNIDHSLDGTAKSCWQNTTARARNGSGHFTLIYNKSEIKTGDILVFNTYSGWYGSTGHIAFADSDYTGANIINCLGQNQGPGSNPTTGKAFNVYQNNLAAFLGGFRYTPWQSPVPPTPTEEKKKRHFPWPVAFNNWPGFYK